MPKEVACKKCKAITIGKVCPVCKSSDLSPDWSGIILVFDPSKSQIASTLEITAPHKYALKVS
ncbi:MAG TPA: transcription elongation factor subunit Spt4 [Nitrososphaeraceae archaeon]|nr:transcription elongation factor Spt4 [Thermoproteota archaeon]HET6800147.1 transcription elongation factor subunit Spt4 [Nitrososphaeraceae archaeon]MDQ3970619.1 transcription elongation factor Spt4 [Thermoproteota archaeon]MDQ4023770.1 transcription elongation factor Spt4 [Thermoproteota archaeon]HKG71183.1 transcription elongation factor subunit Spt4 [Nitrososphaeraceae archaeon]